MPEDRSRFPSAYDRARSRDVGMAPQQEAPVSARIRTMIFDALGGNSPDMAKRRRAMQAADMLTGAGAELAVGMTPVLGDAQAMYEAKQAYDQGNMGRAAILGGLAAVGMVPVVGDIAKKGGDLAMDTASRMARASDQGFDPRTFYHGGSSDFDGFRQGRRGNYFSDDPKIADIYAENAERRWPGQNNASPNVIPVRLKGRALVVSDIRDGSHGWYQDNLAETLGLKINEIPTVKRPQALRDEALKQGYGFIEIRDMTDLGGIQSQFIPLETSNIRSVNAAFDPAKRGSANLLAGGAAAAVGVGAMTRAQQDEQNRRNQ